jgi:hypothetical protein
VLTSAAVLIKFEGMADFCLSKVSVASDFRRVLVTYMNPLFAQKYPSFYSVRAYISLKRISPRLAGPFQAVQTGLTVHMALVPSFVQILGLLGMVTLKELMQEVAKQL